MKRKVITFILLVRELIFGTIMREVSKETYMYERD